MNESGRPPVAALLVLRTLLSSTDAFDERPPTLPLAYVDVGMLCVCVA